MAQDITIASRPVISMSAVAVTSTAAALTVPANARSCMIQADGGTVRVGLAVTPTATLGVRLDDSMFLYIDSDPRQVMLYSASSCTAQVVFYP